MLQLPKPMPLFPPSNECNKYIARLHLSNLSNLDKQIQGNNAMIYKLMQGRYRNNVN